VWFRRDFLFLLSDTEIKISLKLPHILARLHGLTFVTMTDSLYISWGFSIVWVIATSDIQSISETEYVIKRGSP
jgi:hypothetical protein